MEHWEFTVEYWEQSHDADRDPRRGARQLLRVSEIYFSFTSVDDENHLWLITSHVEVAGKDEDAYRAKRAEYDRKVAEARPVMDVVRDLWSGKFRSRMSLIRIWPSYRRSRCRRGRVVSKIAATSGSAAPDAGIILWRKILARELRAIAECRPAKRWTTQPADVVSTLRF